MHQLIFCNRSTQLQKTQAMIYSIYMDALQASHLETWRELQAGNISVSESEIPIVSMGADHACEHRHDGEG